MKFAYCIDPTQNLIHLRCIGRITLAELMAHVNSVNTDPQFRKGMNTLADFSQAFLDWRFEEAQQFCDYVTTIQEARGKCKWAVVAPTDVNFGVIRMFATLSDELSIETSVFRTLEEVLDWLGQETPCTTEDAQ